MAINFRLKDSELVRERQADHIKTLETKLLDIEKTNEVRLLLIYYCLYQCFLTNGFASFSFFGMNILPCKRPIISEMHVVESWRKRTCA